MYKGILLVDILMLLRLFVYMTYLSFLRILSLSFAYLCFMTFIFCVSLSYIPSLSFVYLYLIFLRLCFYDLLFIFLRLVVSIVYETPWLFTVIDSISISTYVNKVIVCFYTQHLFSVKHLLDVYSFLLVYLYLQ